VIITHLTRRISYEQKEKSCPEETPESGQPDKSEAQKADGRKEVVILRAGI
jgi:hypothetical protein